MWAARDWAPQRLQLAIVSACLQSAKSSVRALAVNLVRVAGARVAAHEPTAADPLQVAHLFCVVRFR